MSILKESLFLSLPLSLKNLYFYVHYKMIFDRRLFLKKQISISLKRITVICKSIQNFSKHINFLLFSHSNVKNVIKNAFFFTSTERDELIKISKKSFQKYL